MRKGYGLANLDDGIPITPETSFPLASLSKQFTGAAIAMLILEHRIALTDPVLWPLPDDAAYGFTRERLVHGARIHRAVSYFSN
jgi:CubicO group peptidase (beta-lactamase class C family)